MQVAQRLEEMKAARSEKAKKLWEGRKSLKFYVPTIPTYSPDFIRCLLTMVCRSGNPIKPTPESLKRTVSELLDFSSSDWFDDHSTERYSACGYNDYQSEKRWEAYQEACELWEVYCYLQGITYNKPTRNRIPRVTYFAVAPYVVTVCTW